MRPKNEEETPELFERPAAPLAERMRPRTLDEFVGQQHLLGPDGLLSRLIERDRLPASIFWGDPGSGKTTLAGIIARRSGVTLEALSAVSSGVREVRKIIDRAAAARDMGRKTFLFIDEIHRFNKAQQDALLHAVEDGTLVLIGATTENPSFEVIGPLLSRCRVFRFEPLTSGEITTILNRAVSKDRYLTGLSVELAPDARQALVEYSGGDARVALNGLEVAVELALVETPPKSPPTGVGGDDSVSPPAEQGGIKGGVTLSVSLIERALLARPGRYDKKGDYHYDTASAFIKSLRGSDPDAAVYWLARMIDAGEDPLFIARRMVILASEDIGNANPTALVLAQACADAVKFIGMPEAQLNLSQTALYLASSPKSNAALTALKEATEDVHQDPERPVPLHLRNAVTGLMRTLGYGKGYQYDHEHEGGVSGQHHLPEGLEDRVYYKPSDRGAEKSIGERLKEWWPKRKR